MKITNLFIYLHEYQKRMREQELYLVRWVGTGVLDSRVRMSNLPDENDQTKEAFGINFNATTRNEYAYQLIEELNNVEQHPNTMIVKTGESPDFVREILTGTKIPVSYTKRNIEKIYEHGLWKEPNIVLRKEKNNHCNRSHYIEVIEYNIKSILYTGNVGKFRFYSGMYPLEKRIAYFNDAHKLTSYKASEVREMLNIYQEIHSNVLEYENSLRQKFGTDKEYGDEKRALISKYFK